MRVYQSLQLNAGGSKAQIRAARTRREKVQCLCVYMCKVVLTVAFCFMVVTLFSQVFGAQNSAAGVVMLLALLVVRSADFGIKVRHGVGVIYLVFAIMAFGPHLANLAGPVPGFFVNLLCIFAIMQLTCHNVMMMNQATYVLGYLILQGYDANGSAYGMRLLGLLFAATVVALIFACKHRGRAYRRGFADLFREFDLHSTRSQWQVKHALGISLAMLLAGLLGLPRVMWVGIAAMSIMQPMPRDAAYRVKRRAPFNLVGVLCFGALFPLLPTWIQPYIGILGGIGVGFSATYAWQTIFNTFGALQMAVGSFGMVGAICLRVLNNTIGSLFGFVFDRVWAAVGKCLQARKQKGDDTGLCNPA